MAAVKIAVVALLGCVVLAAAQGRGRQGGPRPEQGQGPVEGTGQGPDHRRHQEPIPEALLQRVFPNGVPAEITALLAQGTPEANQQAWELLRQARREQIAQGAQGRGPEQGQDQGQGQGRGPGEGRGQGRGRGRGRETTTTTTTAAPVTS